MSKVLFAHDGYVISQNGMYYSSAYNNKIVEQYFNIGSNVTFLVRLYKKEQISLENLNKIDVQNFRISGVDNFKSLKGLIKIKTIFRKVMKEVSESDYIVARIPSDLGFMAIYAAKKLKKKYLIEVVGCPWDSLRNHSIIGKIFAPFYYSLQKNMVRNAPYVLYVTENFLQERYKSFGKTISCSDVELKETDGSIVKERLSKIEYLDTKSLTFGSIGPLNLKYKGFDTVIHSISLLNQSGCNHKYKIVGSGDASWLSTVLSKHKADKFVQLIPFMPHEKIFDWFNEIDVYIQPSKTEGLPRALIEALSKGIPSLGSNAGGISELLPSESVFEAGNYIELKDKISKLSIDQLKDWSVRNYQKSLDYQRDNLQKRRIDFYQSFINEI